MNHKDWRNRWTAGNIGWHQADGSENLRSFWPTLPTGTRVLVPLCGKSVDLMWLADQGLEVTGVELSEVAIEEFFAEQHLTYKREVSGALFCYRAVERSIVLCCGDYLDFEALRFDALFDRAALVALNTELRVRYARHTTALLKTNAMQLLITLEYDQSRVDGPPFCVMPEEVLWYWPDLQCVKQQEGLAGCPPKFRDAGVSHVNEVIWVSHQE